MKEELIRVENLKKSFDNKGSLVAKLRGDGHMKVYAVDDVSFSLGVGEIIGLIGESGCGKSTTAKILLKLLDPDSGKIIFRGKDVTSIKGKELEEFRRKVQIVFQDPYEYLNPRLSIMETIAEPLIINKIEKDPQALREIAVRCLEEVGLVPGKSFLHRYPHELSGGQRQRVAVARAIVLQPDLLVADEPTSMLDVSVRAGILNQMLALKRSRGMSMVFITHDIATAGYMCDKIAVMYKGRVVEIGTRDDVISHPVHPYTKALVGVALDLPYFLDHKDEIIADGEVDNYVESGYCSFEKRCVQSTERCRCHDRSDYQLFRVGEDHYVACCQCGGGT